MTFRPDLEDPVAGGERRIGMNSFIELPRGNGVKGARENNVGSQFR